MKKSPVVGTMLACWISTYLIGTAAAGGVSYTYDSAGRLIKAEYGQGRTITYSYSNSGSLLERRVTGLSTNVPRGTLFRFSGKGSDGMAPSISDQEAPVASLSVVDPREGTGISDRPYGMRGGLTETWSMVRLGTRAQ